MCRPNSAGGEEDRVEDGLEEATPSGQGMGLEDAEEATVRGTAVDPETASHTGCEKRLFGSRDSDTLSTHALTSLPESFSYDLEHEPVHDTYQENSVSNQTMEW